MHAHRRRLLAAASASMLLPLLPGCAQTQKDYKPTVGQAGKDVIWVPTPDALVERMLDMAEVKPGDRVVDLGSGDGKITIAAAKRGARARGIEYNPDLVAVSRRNAQAAGVQVDFMQGDIFQVDFRDADVVTLYLLPSLNERLRPILLEMKPGTRVTSHQFTMGGWQPDRTDEVETRDAHLWIVPAKVGGTWLVRVGDDAPVQVQLMQQYQNLEGFAQLGTARVPLELARLKGPAVRFDVPNATGGTLRYDGTADPQGRISGTVTAVNGSGPGRPFIATLA
jgi:SAM-dependent methyltransferase